MALNPDLFSITATVTAGADTSSFPLPCPANLIRVDVSSTTPPADDVSFSVKKNATTLVTEDLPADPGSVSITPTKADDLAKALIDDSTNYGSYGTGTTYSNGITTGYNGVNYIGGSYPSESPLGVFATGDVVLLTMGADDDLDGCEATFLFERI